MISTKANKSRISLAIIPVVLIVIAVAVIFAVVFLGGAAQPPKQDSLVSPADLSAREIFRGNWQKIMQQRQSENSVSQIPVTGGLSKQGLAEPRVSAAYSARLNGQARLQMGMSQRSVNAYSARLTALSGLRIGMSQRSASAYSARLNGQAGLGMGMSQRAIEADADRWTALSGYYQSLK